MPVLLRRARETSARAKSVIGRGRMTALVAWNLPDFCWQTTNEVALFIEAIDDEIEFDNNTITAICNNLAKRGILEKREIANRSFLAARSHKGGRGKFPKFEYRKRPADRA